MTTAVAARRSLFRSPWTVPIAVTGAVAVTILAQPLFASAGSSDLPEVTAEELVSQVLEAEPRAMSGTVVHTARLGLPDLLFTEATGADPLALLGGSSTLRLWTDGAERSRVALLGTMSEWSVVTDGPEAWTYSSSDDEVIHYAISDADLARLEAMGADARDEALARELPTPRQAAADVLAKVEESSSVVIDSQTEVAGRDAYQLIVTPDTDGTLVDRVVLAIDGETMTPLRVQTWSTQDATAPAVEVSFTDVDFAVPSDSVLAFSAPAGASQRDVVVPLPAEGELTAGPATGTDHAKPVVTGTGWETVVEFSGLDLATLMAADPAALAGSAERFTGSAEAQDMIDEFVPDHSDGMGLDMLALYEQLTTEVPEGRLLSSALLSILVTDDGRILVGAVPADTLRAMA